MEPTFTWRDVGLIPARILAPNALVVALTPLVDPRFVTMLEDLRARRFDLVVVEVDPSGSSRPAPAGSQGSRTAFGCSSATCFACGSSAARIAVGRWGDDGSLEAALEGVTTFRRYARRARV